MNYLPIKPLMFLLASFMTISAHAGFFDDINKAMDIADRVKTHIPNQQPKQPTQQPSGTQQFPGNIFEPAAMEYNIDRRGSDYRNFELKQADASLCQSACNGESRCKAWTYVNPGIQSEYAMCWLKDRVPTATSNSCCTSGVKSQGGYAQGNTGETTYIAGRWSSDWGNIRFKQKKDRKTQVVDTAVSGTYPFSNGRIYGQMDGNVLNGYWVQTSSTRDCGVSKHGSRYWGKIRFTFTNNTFKGFLGYCDAEPDINSQWNGRRK